MRSSGLVVDALLIDDSVLIAAACSYDDSTCKLSKEQRGLDDVLSKAKSKEASL